jgi:hypothetical protein
VEHVIVASSLPLVLERSLHDLERWDNALCGGVWGKRFAKVGEKIRQAVDLEHWAAFPDSFHRITSRLGEVAVGQRGAPPSTVLVLSGDVHHSYVAPVSFPRLSGVQSSVVQIVSSPLRNAVPRIVQRGFTFAASGSGRAVGRLLARSAKLAPPEVEWTLETGPVPGNGLCALRLQGRKAELTMHRSRLDGDDVVLVEVHRQRLDGGA